MPTRITREDSRTATNVAASTRGYHERLDRVDAHDAQRVEFLADGAGTQVCAHGRGAGPRHHQNRHDRAESGSRLLRPRRRRSSRPHRIGEQMLNVNTASTGERYGQQQGRQQRDSGHKPRLERNSCHANGPPRMSVSVSHDIRKKLTERTQAVWSRQRTAPSGLRSTGGPTARASDMRLAVPLAQRAALPMPVILDERH